MARKITSYSGYLYALQKAWVPPVLRFQGTRMFCSTKPLRTSDKIVVKSYSLLLGPLQCRQPWYTYAAYSHQDRTSRYIYFLHVSISAGDRTACGSEYLGGFVPTWYSTRASDHINTGLAVQVIHPLPFSPPNDCSR